MIFAIQFIAQLVVEKAAVVGMESAPITVAEQLDDQRFR
jgi:hypothetical protein